MPIEVTVEKATHCGQQSSDSMVQAKCFESLTDRTKLTRDTNYRVRVPGRGNTANPSDFSWIHHPARDQLTQARPPLGVQRPRHTAY